MENEVQRLKLNGQPLTLAELELVAYGSAQVEIDDDAKLRIRESRAVIEKIVADGATVYGVNTGFGRLADVTVPNEKLAQLQANLVRSHAGGLGNPLSIAEARVMVLLRANVLAKGFSGVRLEVLELLAALLNQGVTPVIPEKGSVGASGDLAPLAHLALVAMGEGEVFFKGERQPAAEGLRRAGLQPVQLAAKEGLALLNGTQAMTAVGGLALARAHRIAELADLAGAMSLEALRGTPAAFDARIHSARPHAGQIAVAAHLRSLVAESEIRESHREHDLRVQDAYCLRCMPQVHGAVRGALAHVSEVLNVETGSATDNPLIFPEPGGGVVLSGGNFHGAPLSYIFDYASIVITDLASITERRIDRLLNPDINEGLPGFLTQEAGLSSGFMIAQIAAAALINECQVLSHPSSTGSIPTSGGKEDHVSMGMTGALKFRQIMENAENVLAIELMCAAQGIEFRQPLRPGKRLIGAVEAVRKVVPALNEDREIGKDVEKMSAAIRRGDFDLWRV